MALTTVPNSLTDNLAPPGVVLPFAGTSAPTGWLLCGGQAVSRTTYADLFAAISTTYGVGDGSTTFNLPDLRGRVPAGKDDMGGTAANRLTSGGAGITGTTLGAAGGTETHTLTTGQIPAHAHNLDAGGNSYFLMRTTGGAVGLTSGTGLAVSTTAVQNNTGGGGAHPITQPTIVLNHIIKT
jgi:microcystin-dependent protein